MKPILIRFCLLLLLPCFLAGGCKKEKDDDYVLIEAVNARIFKSLKSLDENNQPKDYDWAISTNKDHLDNPENLTIDDNILAPLNLPDEFKEHGLKVKISGKKYLGQNRSLTSPFFRSSFGYSFEITKIEKSN